MVTIPAEKAPVSIRDHYRIIKFVEEQVKERLRQIEHDWLLVGLRVGYYEPPTEDAKELGEEYKLEFGYLEALDNAPEEEIEREEWERIVKENQQKNPLPIEFVDGLYEEVKKQLEESAGRELLVSVFGVLTGSYYRCWGSGCYCFLRRRRRYCYYNSYLQRCVCYCTFQEC